MSRTLHLHVQRPRCAVLDQCNCRNQIAGSPLVCKLKPGEVTSRCAMRGGREGYVSQQQRVRRPEPLGQAANQPSGAAGQRHIFNLEAAAQLLTDNPHYHVIGIMGTEGSGKSLLANTLLGLANPCTPQAQAAVPARQTSTRPSGPQHSGSEKSYDGASGVFPTRGAGQQEAQRSAGINMRVSALDRTIVIDTQPLLSSSTTLALMDPKAHGPQPGTLMADLAAEARHRGYPAAHLQAVQHLQDLQLAIFLLASCQMVVVMADTEDSPGLWSLLQTADMLQSAPELSQLGQSQSVQHVPIGGTGGVGARQSVRSAEVVFVLSNQPVGSLQPSSLRAKHVILSCMFAGSSLAAKQGQINVAQELEQQQHQHQRQQPSELGTASASDCSPSEAGKAVHLWALPDPTEAEGLQRLASQGNSALVWGSASSAPFPLEPWQHLASRLLSHPRQPWARPMSEREWLRGCVRLWGALQISQELKEYTQGFLRAMSN